MVTTPTVWKARDQVNHSGAGSESDAAIIDIGQGRYVAVWTEGAGGPIATAEGSDLVGQIFDAEGNGIGTEFRVNKSYYFDDEQDAALAPRIGGGFVAVYEDTDAFGTSIVLDAYDVNGTHLFGSIIQADNSILTDTLANPSIAMNASGDYLITYERSNNAGDTDIVGVTMDSSGAPSAEFLIFESTGCGGQFDKPRDRGAVERQLRRRLRRRVFWLQRRHRRQAEDRLVQRQRRRR